MLPKSMYETVTNTTYALRVNDKSLGRIAASYKQSIPHPRNMATWL